MSSALIIIGIFGQLACLSSGFVLGVTPGLQPPENVDNRMNSELDPTEKAKVAKVKSESISIQESKICKPPNVRK